MVQIKILKDALFDLKEISEFISNPFYAKREVQRLRHSINSLKANIHLGKIVPELNRIDIRELVDKNYRIIYRIKNENTLEIIFIHHGSRNLQKRF